MRIRGDQAERMPPALGTFRPDGSWDPAAAAHTPEYDYVAKLVGLRRTSHMSPGMMAEEIATSSGPFSGMFREATLAHWLDIDQRTNSPHACWPLAMTATSAEETVKRAGRTAA